jgi:hypothetical protein
LDLEKQSFAAGRAAGKGVCVYMKVFDSHTHIRGYHNLADTLDVIEGVKEKRGLAGWALMSLTGWDPDSAAQNVLCLASKARYPQCRIYAGLDHFYSGIDKGPQGRLSQLKAFLAMGFDGLKLIESKPSSRKQIPEGLNAPSYEPMFAYLEEEQIPVTWHVADPEENWDPALCDDYAKAHGWFYGDGAHLSLAEIYQEVFQVLERHPRLNLTFAHMFFLSKQLEEADRVMDRYPNVKFDFTPGREMYYNFEKNYAGWRDFFLRRSDRLIFGTDNGWGDEPTPQEKVADGCNNVDLVTRYLSQEGPVTMWDGTQLQGMALPEEALGRILGENFLSLSPVPAKLDLEKALAYTLSLREKVLAEPGIRQEAKAQLEELAALLESQAKLS